MKGCIPLLLGLVLAGCSNISLTQKPSPKDPAKQPAVDSAPVVVIPNPYVDDVTLANKATEETKQELIKRGYKVVASEAEAKLVVIPTVETNVVKLVTTGAARPTDLFTNNNSALPDRSSAVANSLGSLGSVSFQGSSSSIGGSRQLLVIEAFPKDAWDRALIVNELQLQPAWKIRMPLPASLKPNIEGQQIARTADTDFVLPH